MGAIVLNRTNLASTNCNNNSDKYFENAVSYLHLVTLCMQIERHSAMVYVIQTAVEQQQQQQDQDVPS
jgi:hypothetical protein